jgi:hypothetical protein
VTSTAVDAERVPGHDGRMWTDRVRVLDDVAPAQWIADRLSGGWGTVGGLVPDGFAAHARVLHPASRDDRTGVTWAEVAEVTGRRLHAGVQWHALVGSADPWQRDGLWPGGPPQEGSLEVGPLRALCDVLAAHTSTPGECFFGLWAGWAQLHGSPARARLTLTDTTPSTTTSTTTGTTTEVASGGWQEVPSVLAPAEIAAPRLRLPGRDHLVLAGPLDAVEDLARYDGPDVWWTQSPSLVWPADRAWCVATDVDLDSTLVGGSAAAVLAVLASPALEAFRTDPGASLQAGSDHLNPVGPVPG